MSSIFQRGQGCVAGLRDHPIQNLSHCKKETLRPSRSRESFAEPRRALVPLVMLLPVLLGCTETGPPKVAVTGRVTLDGRALEQGAILFAPQLGTPGSKAATEIVDGSFELHEKQGLTIGKFRVQIDRAKKRELDSNGLPIVEKPDPSTTIPSRYNQYTQLVIETSATGENYFEFDLTTETPETQ